MKVTVLGAGAWGTTLARMLCRSEHQVTLWGHDAGHLQGLAHDRVNQRYLPGIPLPSTLRFETELPPAVQGGDCVIVAVPSKGFRQTVGALADYHGLLVSVTKGIEYETGLT